MKISELLNEVNPHNFDSDIDYYDALRAQHRPKPHHPKPQRPLSDQDIEGEIADKRGKAAAAAAKEVKAHWDDHEGVTPEGHKYNRRFFVQAPTLDRLKYEIKDTADYHYGAKKLVGQRIAPSDSPDGPVHGVAYFVDNHKHGMWKPWKDEPAINETATAGATSAGNIATVDAPQLSPGKARGKKSYIGSPGKSGTKAPPQPKVVQPKASNGTAKNALDMRGANLFGGGTVKRS